MVRRAAGWLTLWGTAVMAAFVSTGACAAQVPTWQPVAPQGLGIRFSIPADWGIKTKAALAVDKNWQWEAFSPGQIAWIRISSTRTTLDPARFEQAYVRYVRSATAQALKADPKSRLTLSHPHVAGVPAVRMMLRDPAFSLLGQSGQTTVQYVLVHAGVAYVIDFQSPQKFVSRYLPSLDRAIATMRFSQVA